MKQLNAIDGQFISSEKFSAPEHVGLVILYDQSELEDGPLRFKQILRRFETRIDSSPVFTHKIDRVPFNLDQPYWVEDPNFDLEYHVMHLALPQPGDWRQLCIQLARLHSRGLDMTKPLWQAYVIEGINAVEGVPHGSFALYLKIHHAAADGVSINNIVGALHDLKPTKVTGQFGKELRERAVEPAPKVSQKLGKALFNWMRMPLQVSAASIEIAAERAKARRYVAQHGRALADGKPKTRFDAPITARRVFEARAFSIEDAKSIRSLAPGATLNDVAVATLSLAIRRYLSSKGELPEKSVVGWIPVNLRTEEDKGSIGNAITTLSVPIHTNLEDPQEILCAVSQTTENAKRYRLEVGDDTFTKVALLVPAPFQKMTGQVNTLSAKLGNSAIPANVTITNVPGPQAPLYLAGAKALSMQGLGMIQDGVGLFHIVSSYCDKFQIGITSCREMMPDPEFYAQCVEEAFGQLLAAANR